MTPRRMVWAAVLLLLALLAVAAWELVASPRLAERSQAEPAPSGPTVPSGNPLSAAPSLPAPDIEPAGGTPTVGPTVPALTETATGDSREAQAATDAPRPTRPTKPASRPRPSVLPTRTAPPDPAAPSGITRTADLAASSTPRALATLPATATTQLSAATASASSTPLPAPTSTARATAQPTLPSLATADLAPAGLSGRLLLNGEPAAPGAILVLEDADLNQVAETAVGDNGRYQFTNVPAVEDGYSVSFSWERNQNYDLEQVVAWGWIGPVPFDGLNGVRLPELDIGLQGLVHSQPEPDTRLAAAAIRPETPLEFAWGAHSNASAYWVDILDGSSLARLWRADLAAATSASFSGQLDDGTTIQPGAYWWAIGGRSTVDGVRLTVYSHAAGLRLSP